LKSNQVSEFVLAGTAIFTIVNPITGNRFTYKVTQRTDGNGQKSPHFVSVLAGTDNNSSYKYMGFIKSSTYFIHGGRKAKISDQAQSFKAFAWFWKNIANPSPIEVYHEGKCGRCGRRLTVPESIVSGYGPECLSVIGAEQDQRFKEMYAQQEIAQERQAYQLKFRYDIASAS
jgi:hypothetical protein